MTAGVQSKASAAAGGGGTATPWHSLPAGQCLERLGSREGGLSSVEAQARLRRYGPNALPERKPLSPAALFFRQFRSPLIYLLLAAAAISLALAHRVDAAFIFAVLLINAAVGTVQERRAELGMAALQRLIRHSGRARRDGALRLVDAAELVPGDVVEVESGMAVPADLRLLESQGLQANESLLSGESLPVAKNAATDAAVDAGLGDRPTMLHAGTSIAEGRAVGVVVATGLRTSLGEIQAALGAAAAAAPPPLVLRLARLSRQIAIGAVALILLLAVLLAIRGEPAGEILLLAVALTVSAIPEGLPIAVTVALATATARMARRNVIVRALPAVEGLGACTLIASDKTGTLTRNLLSVERVLLADGRLLDRADWQDGNPDGPLAALARASAVCNEARLGHDGQAVGDTVDAAMLLFAREAGASGDARVVSRAPYEPARRFAAVTATEGAGVTLFVKGAPEVIRGMCAAVDGVLYERAEALAAEGYRIIAVAARSFPADRAPPPQAPCGLEPLGWIALLDPLRPEAADAVARCKAAGIDVRMITGDHPATARTIAAQLGLCSEGSVVTGAEIAAARGRGDRLAALIADAKVFARIEPVQKTIIVEALTAAGHLVAVTGDGVNDAPALQAAHIGVAMGKGGTDVAREAADLVLTDDNFASIVAGVEEGRIVFANLRKIVIFLVATGIAEIFMFIGAIAAGLPMPLTAVQLIWSNLVTNGAQDVMLGFGRGEGDELRQPPRRPGDPILDRTALMLLVPAAFVMSVLALAMMDWALARGASVAEAQNAVLLLTVLFQNAYVLCMRSERRPLWREPIASNRWLLLGVAAALGLQLLAMHWGPLRSVLGTSPVAPAILVFCLAGAAVTVVVTEATKWIVQRL